MGGRGAPGVVPDGGQGRTKIGILSAILNGEKAARSLIIPTVKAIAVNSEGLEVVSADYRCRGYTFHICFI